MGHISLSCSRIKKFSFPSFVYSLFLFLLAFPYHLCHSPMKSGKFVSPEINYEVSWYNIQVVAMRLPQFAMNRPPGNLHAFGCSFSHQKQTHFFQKCIILVCSSFSDQSFMLPFITVALVSDSFTIGKYPYKPAMPFLREQIPKSPSLAWFCLWTSPSCLGKAIITLARKIDTDGRSTTLDLLACHGHREGRWFFKKSNDTFGPGI